MKTAILYKFIYKLIAIQSKGQWTRQLKIHAEEKRPRNNGDKTEEKERMGRKESLFLPDRKRWKRVERTRNKKKKMHKISYEDGLIN